MDIYLCGMMTAFNWVAAAIFLRFWRQTRDRFFLYFALAFVVFGFSRMPRALLDPDSAWAMYPFLVRHRRQESASEEIRRHCDPGTLERLSPHEACITPGRRCDLRFESTRKRPSGAFEFRTRLFESSLAQPRSRDRQGA
jgi:hypothetical protein